MARWLPRALAIALLLLGGSLAVGGLVLPWWHITQYDGTPFPYPPDNRIFTPGVRWDPHDVVGHLLLVCPVVAAIAGLVALLPSVRPSAWLKALLAPLVLLVAAMGCAGLALVIEAGAPFFLDCACRLVHDDGPLLSGLGYALIFVGDALVFWILDAAAAPSAVRR